MAASSSVRDTSPRSLAEDIRVATRSVHTRLNKLILARLPLALPPCAADPSLYLAGLLHVTPIYVAFEDLWRDIVAPGADERSQAVHDAAAGAGAATAAGSPAVHALLAALRLPGLMRADRLRADIASLTGWQRHVVDAQLQAASRRGHLAHYVDHIRRTVALKPHVLVAYSYILYMALFAGGRFIRATLERPGPPFWGCELDWAALFGGAAAADRSGGGPAMATAGEQVRHPYGVDDGSRPQHQQPHLQEHQHRLQQQNQHQPRYQPPQQPHQPPPASRHHYRHQQHRHHHHHHHHHTDPPPAMPNNASLAVERPGDAESTSQGTPVRFLHFNTPTDGEDLKTEYKKRLQEAEAPLTDSERADIVQEAVCVFDNIILLVGQLDALAAAATSASRSSSASSQSYVASLAGMVRDRLRDSIVVTKQRWADRSKLLANEPGQSVGDPGGDGDNRHDRRALEKQPLGLKTCPATAKSVHFGAAPRRPGSDAASAAAGFSAGAAQRLHVARWLLTVAAVMLLLGASLTGRRISWDWLRA